MELTSFPGYVPEEQQLASAEEDCTICIEKLGADTKVLDCNHVFHQKCINTWLSVSNTCPVCRKPGEVAIKTRFFNEDTLDFVIDIGVNSNINPINVPNTRGVTVNTNLGVNENSTRARDIIYKILLVLVFVCILVTSGMFMYYHLKMKESIHNHVVNATNVSDLQNASSISYFQNSSTNSSNIGGSSTKISVYDVTILVLTGGISYGAQLVSVLSTVFGKKRKWIVNAFTSFAVLFVVGLYAIDMNSALRKLEQSGDYELTVDEGVNYLYDLVGSLLVVLLVLNIVLNGLNAFLIFCCHRD